MSGFYSIQPRIRSGIIRPTPLTAAVDPYDQSGAEFAERNRKHTVALPNGLVREDIGEPLRRLPSETQPVLTHKPTEPPKAPAKPLPETPAEIPRMDPKPHRAITRNP